MKDMKDMKEILGGMGVLSDKLKYREFFIKKVYKKVGY